MKQNSPLWGSVSILIGVVVAILALVRGAWLVPLLVAAFGVWGAWVVWSLVIPAQQTQRRCRQGKRLAEQAADTDRGVMLTLLRHVNYRISGCLKTSYPEARWEWTMNDPAAFVAMGGTGRIRVYGVDGFDHADVTLDRNGKLTCALVKLETIGGGESTSLFSGHEVLDPRVWYENHGRTLLRTLVADLDSRGHHSLTLEEDGSIRIEDSDRGTGLAKASFSNFPAKVYWPGLVKVLEQDGLAAVAKDTCIAVAW